MASRGKTLEYSVSINASSADKTLRQLYKDKQAINKELLDMKLGTEAYAKKAAELKNVDDQLKEHRKNVGAVTESQKDLARQTGLFGAEINMITGVLGKFKAAVQLGIASLKTLKGAMAATGIGLLIVAIGSLFAYFTKTKRGAELLDRVMAAWGATVSVITDRLSAMGESIMAAVTNPKKSIMDFGNTIKEFILGRIELVMKSIDGFGNALSLLFEGEFKAAAKAAGEAFIDLNRGINPTAMVIEGLVNVTDKLIDATTDVINEITKEAQAAYDLEAAMQRLVDRERDLRVESAQTMRDIRARRLLVEDETLSYEQRLAALQEAINMELALNEKTLAAARERVSITQQQIDLGESMAEDYDRLADAQVALADAEASSLKLQKTLTAEYNTLLKESEAVKLKQAEQAEKERQAALDWIAKKQVIEQEAYEATLSQIDLEIVQLMKAYEDKVALAEQYGLDTKQFTEKLEKDIYAINQKYRDADLKAEQEKASREYQLLQQKHAQQRAIASSGADILSALSTFVGEDTVQGAKLARNAALLQIGVDTAEAISAAVAASAKNPANATTFGGAGALQFIAMSATILGNIAKAKALLSQELPTYTPATTPTFAFGGYTGLGFGSPDSTGHVPVGIVHENEWVAPEWMTSDPRTANTIAYLESLRKSGRAFADGGYTSTAPGAAAAQNSPQIDKLTIVLAALTAVLQGGITASYSDAEVQRISEVQNELQTIENDLTV